LKNNKIVTKGKRTKINNHKKKAIKIRTMVYFSLHEREMKGARKERATNDKLIIFI